MPVAALNKKAAVAGLRYRRDARVVGRWESTGVSRVCQRLGVTVGVDKKKPTQHVEAVTLEQTHTRIVCNNASTCTARADQWQGGGAEAA